MSQLRLTLRTLLAYLDDTLSPTDSRTIGAKLADNPEAMELVERIRKVIRKRSLAVPSSGADGSAADPNTVARYLDNQLEGEELASYETACLEQDLNLAEVAACHKILSIVVCGQMRTPPTARQRMYQLVKGRESIPERKTSSTPPVGGVADDADSPEAEEYDIGLLMGLQSYQQGDSWKKFGLKFGLAAALTLVFVAGLWMALPPERAVETGTPVAVLSPSAKRPETQPTTRATPATSAEGTAPTSTPATPPTAPANKPLDPAALPGPMPVPVPPDMPPPTNPPVPSPQPMPNDPPPKLNPKKTDLVPPVPEPSKDRAELGKSEEPKSIIIKKNPAADSWVRILPDEPIIRSTDRLMALPGYKAKVLLDSDVQLELWGNLPELTSAPVQEASVTPYLPAQGVDADLQVHTGRIYLNTKRKAGARVQLRFRNELWEVVLKDEKSEVVFELFNTLVPGTQDIPRTIVGLYVLEGQAIVKDRFQPEATLQKGGEILWDSKEGQARVQPTLPANLPAERRRARDTYLAKLPLYPASTRPTLLALGEFAQQLTDPKRVRAAFDAALSDRPDQPVTDQVRAAGRVAILTFAALADAPGLGDALNDPSRGIFRAAAIQGIRSALANDPTFAGVFRQNLVEKNRVGDEIADQILLLLRGVSPRQRVLPDTFDRLLKGLSSPSVAVRELSLESLVQQYLTPEDKNLQPLLVDVGAPPEVRDAAIAAWTKRAEELKTRAMEANKE